VLRDALRTLMRATLLIRRAGLRARMRSPEEFLREVNRRSIQMSQQGRRSGSKRGRKRVLRKLKRVVEVVRAHAQRHRDLLERQTTQPHTRLLTARQRVVTR